LDLLLWIRDIFFLADGFLNVHLHQSSKIKSKKEVKK